MKDVKKSLRMPMNGTFEITARCNLRCKMCYVRMDEESIKALGSKEYTAEKWIDLANQAQRAGTLSILITGGEPMLRPDFPMIYEAIARLGFIVTLYTNATMVTPRIMEVLRRYPPHSIGVTIYGSNPKVYERVCGNAGAFEKMQQGLKQLLTLPSKLELRTTIIKDNLEDRIAIEKLAKSFGEAVAFNITDKVLKQLPGAAADPVSCRLSPEQSVSLLFKRIDELSREKLNNKKNKAKSIIEGFAGQDSGNAASSLEPNSIGFYGCNAGISEYTVTWDGRLIPCSLLRNNYTRPFQEGLLPAWDRLPEVLTPFIPPQKCRQCTYRPFCETCAANRYCETGEEKGIPLYFCKKAENLYNIFNTKR